MSRASPWPWPAHFRFLCSRAMSGSSRPQHQMDLEASGLWPAICDEQMIRSVPPNMIRALLGFDVPGVRSALLFPFFTLGKDALLVDFVRVKVFPPSVTAK